MGDNRMDPRKQFSKRLAIWTAVFWFAYMSWLSVLMLLEPNVAQYCFYMGMISTVVMIVNEIAYTHNSVMEKLALAMLDKTRIELSLGGKSADAEEEDEDTGKGGESNG